MTKVKHWCSELIFDSLIQPTFGLIEFTTDKDGDTKATCKNCGREIELPSVLY